MNKKLLTASLIGIIVLGGIIFWAFKSEKSSQSNLNIDGMVFFYSESCPHCKNVEKFLEENKNIEEKVKFTKLEVSSNKENQAFFVEKAKQCKIDMNNLGVPLFWDGNGCSEGDADIIELLKEKANQ